MKYKIVDENEEAGLLVVEFEGHPGVNVGWPPESVDTDQEFEVWLSQFVPELNTKTKKSFLGKEGDVAQRQVLRAQLLHMDT